MATSKMSRNPSSSAPAQEPDGFGFDFGEPEVIPVEISPGKFLSLMEPSADDLMEIDKISEDKDISELEATLRVICILHSPDHGQRKLTLKDAKKLRAKQLKLLGSTIGELLGSNQSSEDSDNEEQEEEGDE